MTTHRLGKLLAFFFLSSFALVFGASVWFALDFNLSGSTSPTKVAIGAGCYYIALLIALGLLQARNSYWIALLNVTVFGLVAIINPPDAYIAVLIVFAQLINTTMYGVIGYRPEEPLE